MKTYTFIAHYRGKHYLTQYMADDLLNAVYLWGNNLDKKVFTLSKRTRILKEIEDPDKAPIPIRGIEKVWCACYLSDKSFLILDIIETV